MCDYHSVHAAAAALIKQFTPITDIALAMDNQRCLDRGALLSRFLILVLLIPCPGMSGYLASLHTADPDKSVPDEYLAVAKVGDNPDSEEISGFGSSLEHQPNLQVMRTFRIGKWEAALIRGNSTAVKGLLHSDRVSYIEANQWIHAADPEKPELEENLTKRFGDTSCLEQLPGDTIWGLGRLSRRDIPDYSTALYRYDSHGQGEGIDVYVADSGINVNHVEFGTRASSGYTVRDLREEEGDDDLHGHGTHVASIVAGSSVGVAKQAHVLSVKVLNSEATGQITWAVEGLAWIVAREKEKEALGINRGAVINLSLGSPSVSYTMDEAVQATVAAGIPVVVAAGNAATDACDSSPGRVSAAVTVSATTRTDHLAYFSNYGPCVDIMAPGLEILGAAIGSSTGLAYSSGTSQASPFTAGVLANYLSSVNTTQYKIPTPAFLKAYLADTATKDRVQFDDITQRSTPNHILYNDCTPLNDTELGNPPIPNFPLDDSAGAEQHTVSAVLICALTIAHFSVTKYDF